MKSLRLTLIALLVGLFSFAAQAAGPPTPFGQLIPTWPDATLPLVSGDYFAIAQPNNPTSNTTPSRRLSASLVLTTAGVQNITNKTIDCNLNTCVNFPAGSSLTITDGTHTVSATTQILFSGAVVSGATPNSIVTVTAGGSGTVTSVTCGVGLTGGTFTTSGTCALANLAPVLHQFVSSIASNLPVLSQPAFTDLSGSASAAQITTNLGAAVSTMCSASTSQFVRGDGTCQVPAGGGNVSTSGAITNGTLAVWVTGTTINGTQAFSSTPAASTIPETGGGNTLASGFIPAINLAASGAGGVTGNLPLTSLATQAANTILGALTAITPSALPIPSCSGASNALIWTSGTGFGCNTISGGGGSGVPNFTGATASNQTLSLSTTTSLDYVAVTGAASGAFTYTLPVSTGLNPGQTLFIADDAQVVSNANPLTIAAGAGDTINLVANISMNQAGQRILLQLDKTTKNWVASGSIPNGSSAQILLAQGSATAPAWVTQSGDTIYNNLGVSTTSSVKGVVFSASPSVNQVCVTTSGIACTYGTVDAALSSNVPLKNGANAWTSTQNWQGSLANPIREVTAAGSITVSSATDFTVVVNKTVGAATAVGYTCPASFNWTFLIKDGKGDDATNPITITPTSGSLDGKSNFIMNTSVAGTPPYDRIAVHCNSTTGNSWIE